MGARYLTELVDVLEAAELDVVSVDGWETRARSSGGFEGNRPWCIMWHHTASQTHPENDVGYICYGSPDAPLANLLLDRDGTVWVCAAGATNTNGKGDAQTMSLGTVPADSMNTHAIGIEAANSGVGEVWPQVQVDAYFRINNALAAAYGLQPDDCRTHESYAPGRKVDPATAAAVQGPWRPASINSSGTWRLEDIHDEAWLRSAQPTPTPPGDDDMTDEQARQLTELHSAMVVAQPGFTSPDGADLNAAWSALWGYFIVANNVVPMLADIQTRLAKLEG